MPCNISLGYNEPCKDSVAGLTAVYFMNFNTGSFVLNATDVVTAFPSGSTVYKYELKGTNGYTETVNTSRDNGTTFFSQELSLQLKKLTAEATKELKLLAYSRPKIVVADRNGNAFLVGKNEGADMTAGTITTGTAYGDLSGYTMVFTGQEQLPANFLSGSTLANPIAGVSQPPTVVYGTNS
jgi:uncharacterized protein GlcG (DUF336 family)